jgi:DNA-directed RNA polymerase I subunit RPA2
MTRKLYALVSHSCCPDNPDSPAHQEILLPGFLYGMIIKERMEEIVDNLYNQALLTVRQPTSPGRFDDRKSTLTHKLFLMNI